MLVYKSFLEQLVDELSTTCTEVDFNIYSGDLIINICETRSSNKISEYVSYYLLFYLLEILWLTNFFFVFLDAIILISDWLLLVTEHTCLPGQPAVFYYRCLLNRP